MAGSIPRRSVAWRRLDEPSHVPRHLTTQGTDPQGRFLMRGFPSGRYLFTAWDGERTFADVELDVEEEKTQSVRIALP